ncbi:MAG: DUF4347 domain-containing protein [Trichodesmium sp. St16_bin4-tuft]|nr:DUF4347 domain-containing protein [Trichodesmium sp. St4_bin8_1]MDE5072416.1 DUF4347 domain-containing protein [Trichodesmium sp. St5_bin8]MDE5077061.1 DUF4347 domain-containing protein [Trichodesmium sp. St2_bin6]MDE5092608.1 DUF4347 domain-containing protein [Trichodesmium sp. St18_bin3_1_1]MDE5099690.1 DUF4347 domain-containing protein [Trichodesmium sp. St16_bin4-tuft]MDE5103498.1 DUF4347 domain-containing protein [Trichodesmium sp. St19_bin2]MDT9340061.1 DUF4347 domain-containing prot
MEDLSRLIGRDVAASDDLTGNSVLRSDWNLEVETGPIAGRSVVGQNAMGTLSPKINCLTVYIESIRIKKTVTLISKTMKMMMRLPR